MFDQATQNQHAAARPDTSTWVTANAGSGKTRVLTDRVARLLLEGVAPQNILCLTYTKAAASEMQNRLFKRLGEWAMLDDEALRTSLRSLGEQRAMDSGMLAQARTLFARAIETPGGLKIQTIHAFCSALLRRFPLEAGVTPNFTEIDDRVAQLMRARIVEAMASDEAQSLVTDIARYMADPDFDALTATIVENAENFPSALDRSEVLKHLECAQDLTEEALLSEVFHPDDLAMIARVRAAMETGSATDIGAAQKLSQAHAANLSSVSILESVMLTGASAVAPFSAKIGKVPTKATAAKIEGDVPAWTALMQRVEHARPARLGLALVRPTQALHAFGREFLDRYESAKSDQGLLDFDDLIKKAKTLLSDSEMAGWVLYKLDGQIDHILVDEAQDTSPVQWDVIGKIAEDFISGASARTEDNRTLFVVGDRKQSIYSFQGADPDEFDRMRKRFAERLHAIDAPFQNRSLDHSFRSAPSILRLVDTVFEDHASQGLGEGSEHIPFHLDLPGRVDVWPVVEPAETQPKTAWHDPVDLPSPAHHHATLAEHIAQNVSHMLASGTQLPLPNGSSRALEPRDILILVQRRSGIFPHIIRACKTAGLPIAGSDKLKVGAELAVRDLGALLSFLATPDDDLSLASTLRSPLFGWSEQDLFDLAHYRPDGMHLWAHLRKLSDAYPDTCAILNDMRSQIDFLRPFELLGRILNRHDKRRAMIGRLGSEAEDGIDALLSQALSYERNAIPSLTGFLAWMQTDDLEIKRQVDSMSNQIRVMSVHGAKGLEAPVVILPDTIRATQAFRDSLLPMNGMAFPKPKKEEMPPAMSDAAESAAGADAREAMRLLYVAMTRAEKWLIVAGAGVPNKSGKDWHTIVERAMPHAGSVTLETPVGPGLRVENGIWPVNSVVSDEKSVSESAKVPAHFYRPASPPLPNLPVLSPSELGGAKALPGEGMPEDIALAYGTYVHSILENGLREDGTLHVPSETPADLGETLANKAQAEALTVMQDPALGHLFDPETLAEVDVTATLFGKRMYGTIDRLIIADDHIQIIDFKTNRTVPQTPEETPDGILRQMAAYQSAVAQIYPDHDVRCAILWTAEPRLVAIPHELVSQAKHEIAHLDDPMDPT